jgi:transcriptional regulator with XRE-family HTH domain
MRLPNGSGGCKAYGNIVGMAGNNGSNPATHFGRQLRKERLARGWSVHEFARRSGISAGHTSRIENGVRPPTEAIALVCDTVFPERKGWFGEYYEESRHWSEVPASFKSWPEYEDKAASLRDWSPSIVTGLLQSEGYARALLATLPGVSGDTVATRLASRMERQRRVLMRDTPPSACFLVDELSLYRRVGSAEVMAAQLGRLLEAAARARTIVQVLPAVAHPVNASGFLMADNAVWIEHAAGGFTYTDEETVSALTVRFDTLRSESYRASESAALIERLAEIWTAGGNPLTQTPTVGTA